MSDKPSLAGQLAAWVRQGAKDLHNLIVPAFPESYRGVDEPGNPLSPTSQMVTEDLQQHENFDSYLRQQQQGREAGRDKGMEAGM